MHTILTFQCRECGVVVKVLIRSDKKYLTFSIIGKLHNEKECLTKSRFFHCIECNTDDNTIRFEKVYN